MLVTFEVASAQRMLTSANGQFVLEDNDNITFTKTKVQQQLENYLKLATWYSYLS